MKNIPCTRCLDDHTIRFDELHPQCLQAIRDAIEPCLEDEAVITSSGRQYRFVDWEKAFAEEGKS